MVLGWFFLTYFNQKITIVKERATFANVCILVE